MEITVKHKTPTDGLCWKSSIKDLDPKGTLLIAVNAFGNVDSDNDISAPGSFKKTLKENFARVRWFLNHDVTLLLGVPIEGHETSEQLVMKARLNMEKQIGRDTYEDYKLYAEQGNTLEHSVGLQPIKYTIDRNKEIRTITEWKLWEFSTLTHWGSNENTPMLGMKSLLETMIGRPYSDKRKKEIEDFLESLTKDEEPDESTPSPLAGSYINKLFSFTN